MLRACMRSARVSVRFSISIRAHHLGHALTRVDVFNANGAAEDAEDAVGQSRTHARELVEPQQVVWDGRQRRRTQDEPETIRSHLVAPTFVVLQGVIS